MKSVLIRISFVILLTAVLFLVLAWRNQQAQPDLRKDEPGSNNTIVAAHTYANGKHTLEGTVDLPTPCHELITETIVMESMPERVVVKFTVKAPEADTFCIQMISQGKFKSDFWASENPVISATLNGQPVSLVIEDQSGTLRPIP